MKRFVLIGLLALAACDDGRLRWFEQPNDPAVFAYVNDQCLVRARGPNVTHYNDWAEAIGECRTTAENASRYCPAGARCTAAVSLADVRRVLPARTPHQ